MIQDGIGAIVNHVTSNNMLTSIQIDRRVLLGFLAVMFVINAAVLAILWKEIMAGKNDFPIFYSNAQMVREGKASGLYDFEAENRFIRRVSDVQRPPNNHLPYELLLFVPFTYLKFRMAYIVWTILSLAMLAGVAAMTGNIRTGGSTFSLRFLTVLAFYPVWYCLLMGHDSILMLFLFTISFCLWKRGNDDLAGFVIALGLFRPQLVLPFVFIAFVAGKWKFVRGFLPGAALAVTLSTWIVGWHGMADYVRVLLAQGTEGSAKVLDQQWEIDPGIMPTWRGFLWLFLPRWVPPGVRIFFLLVGTFWGLGWAAKKMRTPTNPAAFDAAFAIAVATALLVSYHSFLNDFSLMILPLLILGVMLVSVGKVPRLNAYLIATVGFLLFLTPLYMMLMSTGVLASFFVVELVALCLTSRWGANVVVVSDSAGGTARAISGETA